MWNTIVSVIWAECVPSILNMTGVLKARLAMLATIIRHFGDFQTNSLSLFGVNSTDSIRGSLFVFINTCRFLIDEKPRRYFVNNERGTIFGNLENEQRSMDAQQRTVLSYNAMALVYLVTDHSRSRASTNDLVRSATWSMSAASLCHCCVP